MNRVVHLLVCFGAGSTSVLFFSFGMKGFLLSSNKVLGGKPAQQMRTLLTHLLTFLANKHTNVDEYIYSYMYVLLVHQLQ